MLPSLFKHQAINPDFHPTYESLVGYHLTQTVGAKVIELISPFRSIMKRVAQHPAVVSDYELDITHAFGRKPANDQPHFFKGVTERMHSQFFWISVSCYPGLVEQFGGQDLFGDLTEVVARFTEKRQSMTTEDGTPTRFLLAGTDRSIDFQLVAQYVHEALIASNGKLRGAIVQNPNELMIALADVESDVLVNIGFPNTEAGVIPYTPTWGNGSPMFTDRNPRPNGMTDDEVLYLIMKPAMDMGGETAPADADDEELPQAGELLNPGKLGEAEQDLDQTAALASDSVDTAALREEQGLGDPEAPAVPVDNVTLIRPMANKDGSMSYVLSASAPDLVENYLMRNGINFADESSDRTVLKVTLDENDPDPQDTISRIVSEINQTRNPA